MVLQPIRQPATQLVFQLIAQCIGSSDKFHVVSGKYCTFIPFPVQYFVLKSKGK